MIEELAAEGIAILYTTHYMEEAERLCDRIAIIDHGRIIALGTQEELVSSTLGRRRTLTVESEGRLPEALRDDLRGRGATLTDGTAVLAVAEPAKDIPEILDVFRRHGVAVRDLTLKAASLEDVFLHLTGRELRE
jgi:ABC-2 type transport system ATP-binding protein